MKSTNTNKIQTTGDLPVAIKAESPPRRRTLCLAMAALAGFAASAQAAIINVNVGNVASANALTGKAYLTGGYAQAPITYPGTAWNDIASTPNYSVSALLDSNGNTTVVAFATTSPTAMEGPLNWLDHANVPLLQGGIKRNNNSSSGKAMAQRAKVSGLVPGNLYHLAVIGCQQDKAAGEWGIGTASTAPTTTKTIINTLPAHENWVAGDNYAVFYRVPADTSGEIYLWGKGLGEAYPNGIVLNGVQIIDAADLPSPENQMVSFSFPGVSAVINQTTKTITCSMYGDVTNLTPTLSVSSGATCSPATGVPNNFSGSQTYTVYAEDGTANVYTVTVTQLAPTITTRGDGYTLATFTDVGGGTWTVPSGVTTMEVLVVGGGGGGGNGYCSGSGAGGMYSTGSYAVTPGASVSIAIGAGGVAGTNAYGGTGKTSQFSSLLAYGGTSGQGYTDGGDQGGYSADGGTTIVPGNLGMHYTPFDGNWSSGGGAGHVGYKGDGQPGGIGLQCAITGTNTYYAGGGAAPGNPGLGGLGGGGNGTTTVAGCSGQANTGGGAGGSWGVPGGTGGTGGSGVVILAYLPGITTYTVTFDSNSGSSVPSQEVPSGGKATLPVPAPTRSGYTFAQWCSDSGLNTAFDFANTTITEPTTIYAKWLVNYTVDFESNGGSGVSSQTVPDGNTATEPTVPTRTGYTFGGWFADSGLTPPAFSFSTPITVNRMLYAMWTINSYTLTYNAGSGGSIIGTTPQSVEHLGSGTSVSADANPGWTFLKWSDNSTDNPRTDSNIVASLTVTAIFQPPFPAIATRGDGYTLATFLEGTGTWTIPAGVTSVEVLVVGGGGGGAIWAGGSGGGGMYYASSYAVTPGSEMTITVGAGGIASTSGEGNGGDGQASQFGASLIAYGGIHGKRYSDAGGGNQGGYSLDGGSTIVPGMAPAEPRIFPWWSGSGAGAPGTVGDSAPGGIGAPCSITGTAAYYAGGGGSNANGVGGLGGGGDGAYVFGGPSHPGATNTGGGAGGGWGGTGANGGSGIVIVAYLGGTTPYQTWAAGPFANAFTDTDPSHDPDGDGLTNQQEFAFGLDPTTGTSVNPITAPLNKSNHKVSYTRYAASGLTYTVWTSTDLQGWDLVLPGDMTENAGTPNGAGVATVEVTLTNPPVGDKLFVRVQAE
jgi:uncharacterized repeat protein (TIGR02543 family)